MPNDLPTEITKVTRELRKPAGPSPLFADFPSMQRNRKEFVLRVHETWKRLHDEAIRKLYFWDAFARRETQHPTSPLTAQFAEYNQHVWRKVNDAIVWSIFGEQRHKVKRLCLYRDRTYLNENNDAVALATINQLNADPLAIAIWNDATSCVDIGDVMFVPNGITPHPTLIELKEGPVNDTILPLLSLKDADLEVGIRALEAAYGKKAVQQYHRIVRQQLAGDQALTLLNKERGVDPVSGHEMSVFDLGDVGLGNYNAELNVVLKDALSKGAPVLHLVADCVWVYANPDKRSSFVEVFGQFKRLLIEKEPPLKEALSARLPKWDKNRPVPLSACFFHPVSKPLYLRALDPEIVGSVTYGDLMRKVYLYIDWKRFAAVVEAAGAQLTWVSGKQARRAQTMKRHVRPPTIGGRVPLLTVGTSSAYFSDPNLVQVLFDGSTPRAIIDSMVKLAQSASA